MGTVDPTKWATAIAEELIVGGVRVPFERVLARHVTTLETRDDISQFISRETVLACVEVGVRERPPQQGIKYFSFVDPSGGSSDSAVAVVGHAEGRTVVVDAIREILSPHDPESAVDEFVSLFKAYNIRKTNGDAYAAKWSSQAFEKRKIEYKHSELATSQLYLNILPHINSKTIKLLDNPCAINQFAGLERRTSRGGRDTITHPSSGHDDVANAIAGLAYVAINLNQTWSLPVPNRYVYAVGANGVLSAIEPDSDERYLHDDPFLQRESQRRGDVITSVESPGLIASGRRPLKAEFAEGAEGC